MKITHLLSFLIIFFFASCSTPDYIYYTYDGTTVTRIDDEDGIYFYHGRFNNGDSLPNSYLKATYKGRDGYMEGYLVFKDDNNVDLIRTGGIWDTINAGKHLKLTRFKDNAASIKWNDEKEGNYNNVFQLSSAPESEIRWNKENKSNVNAEYMD